ncbi:MAG: thiamine ABC transporter substrate-binding protein [Actinobacteria bacterium]|uniref:Unannotated protein n=1 Tax=freshwater metagenome TaxID=449393 RepID=A0A6J6SA49_9ZZZZ|nr:thiamine ABC transporter substrate-binding protein [Actinomycetota bacterium]
MRRARTLTITALTAVLTLTAGCSLAGGDGGDRGSESAAGPDSVVLVTHDSFTLPDDLIAQFEEESGYQLEVRASGDAGELTSKLVLSADNPLGDVAFGVDNTFASRAIDAGVFAPYSFDAPAGVADFDLPGDEEHVLTPVDNGNVCVNVDTTWFEREGVPAPTDLDDLVDPAYRDLLVTPGATTSSPGMAFLLTTIAAYGDGWQQYWSDLLGNGARVVKGWSDAYYTDFTQGGGEGDRPIVVSYDSSPAFTIADDGSSTTAALLDTCFEQVEYAGVLAGAANVPGAEELIRFLVSPEVQAALPESMYVFPVVDDVALPADWERFAARPTQPYAVDPAEVTAERDTWLRDWSDLVSR